VPRTPPKEKSSKVEPKVVFQDSQILVLNKPAGWTVNEAETAKGQKIIQKWLTRFDYPLAKNKEKRSGIVHRLDKETSGLLLVAKTADIFRKLQEQFKKGKIKKTYLALIHGRLEPERGKIKAPIGRLPWRRDRFGVLPGGRSAETAYQINRYFTKDNQEYSLVEIRPITGRTHQIRVHFKFLAHPVVADEFYAGRKTSRQDRTWCPRLFLHAAAIEFVLDGKKRSFKSDLPVVLKLALGNLSAKA